MRSDSIPLPSSLRAFLLTAVTCTSLSLLVAWIQTIRWGVKRGFQGLWLYNCSFDFYDYIPRYLHRHTVEFFAQPGYLWYYPAPAIFVHVPFYVVVTRSRSVWIGYSVFLVLTGLLTITLAVLFGRQLVKRGLKPRSAVLLCVGMFLCAYPIYFAAQRGNIEALTWMLLGVGVWALLVRRPLLSSVLLGIAASVKIYPGLFLALYLTRRGERRWVLVGLAVFAVMTVAGLWYLDPHLRESAAWVARGIGQWTHDYTKDYPNYPWDHAVFGQVRLVMKQPQPDLYRHALKLYYLVAPVVACAVAWRMRRFPLTNQILFLTCAAVTLPPASFDYTLCMMYVPLAVLAVLAVQAARQSLEIPGLRTTMVLLAVVTAPEMFAMTTNVQWVPATIKCAALLLLIVAGARWPLALSEGVPVADISEVGFGIQQRAPA